MDKKVKQAALFRKKVWVPAVVSLVCFMAYFFLFLDVHLRMGLEKGLELVNQAQVDISDLKTKITDGHFKFSLNEVEMTDPNKPTLNRLKLGQLGFDLNLMALLKGRVLIENGGLKDIQLQSPRKSIGKVYLKKEEEEEESAGGNDGASHIKKQMNDWKNELGKSDELAGIIQLFDGKDPKDQVKEILENDLKSIQKIKELENKLTKKDTLWKQNLDGLPDKNYWNDQQEKIKALSAGKIDFKNIKTKIKQAKELSGQIKSKVGEVKTVVSSLKNEIQNTQRDILSIDQLIKEDKKALQDKLKIPSFEAQGLAKSILGPIILKKLGPYMPYIEKVLPYVQNATNSKDVKQKKETPRLVRWMGQQFFFSHEKALPLFWLKKFEISTKETKVSYSGNVAGEIKNLSSHPQLTGQPSTGKFKGNFTKLGIRDFDFHFIWEGQKGTSPVSFGLNVGEYKVQDQLWYESKKMSLQLEKASGGTVAKGFLAADKLDLTWDNSLNNPMFLVDTKQANLKKVFSDALNSMKAITTKVKINGPYTKLNWKITSNLSQGLSNGLKGALSNQVNEAKQKVNHLIDSKVLPHKKRLEDQYQKIKSKYDSLIKNKEGQANEAQNLADNQVKNQQESITSLQKSQQQKAQNKVEDKVKDKLKGFGKKFGF